MLWKKTRPWGLFAEPSRSVTVSAFNESETNSSYETSETERRNHRAVGILDSVSESRNESRLAPVTQSILNAAPTPLENNQLVHF